MRTVAFILLVGVVGCNESPAGLAGDDGDPVTGIIELVESSYSPPHPRPAALDAPDTVTAGVPFTATVTTIGLNGCWREAGSTVAMEPRRAVIRAFDRRNEGTRQLPRACTDALTHLPRSVQLVFNLPGDATLRLEGRRVFDGDVAHAALLAVEKRVHVR